MSERRFAEYVAGVVVLLLALGVVVYYSLYILKLVPLSFALSIKLAVALVAGYLAIRVLSREVRRFVAKLAGEKRGNSASVLFEYVSYILLGVALLALAGVNGTALLAGGTFAGLVLGLASQTVLSNIFAGALLLVSRPFEVGDRVTVMTWQYSILAPTYSPKFFSQERILPGFSGKVTRISLNYTSVQLDEGTTIKIPNNIMIQAAVIEQEVPERTVRARYEAPKPVNTAKLLEKVSERVKQNTWVTDPNSVGVYVEAITPSSVVLIIDAHCRGSFEEAPRSSILTDVEAVVEELKGDRGAGTSPPQG